jgi:hypothetical protein
MSKNLSKKKKKIFELLKSSTYLRPVMLDMLQNKAITVATLERPFKLYDEVPTPALK